MTEPCHPNKYDLLIESKFKSNSLSRAITTSDNRFKNPFESSNQPGLIEVVRSLLMDPDESNIPKNKEELDKELPILEPNFSPNEETKKGDFRVTWIGHATTLVQVDGINILTDPIFSQRASPSQLFGPKRYRKPACSIESLPPVNYVIVSHSHYDHLDAGSVSALNRRFGSHCRWIVPLGLGLFLKSMSVENFVELNWWQKECCHVSTDSSSNNNEPIAIYLTPNQHWSKRTPFDTNKSLWGSYTIVNKLGGAFFFAGDTGYCRAFKEIGDVFGPFVGAAIPIAPYRPRTMMKASHVDPNEAVQIHQDLKSKSSMSIHHSTFSLASHEYYKEPTILLNRLMSELKAKDSTTKPFVSVKHGETIIFSSK